MNSATSKTKHIKGLSLNVKGNEISLIDFSSEWGELVREQSLKTEKELSELSSKALNNDEFVFSDCFYDSPSTIVYCFLNDDNKLELIERETSDAFDSLFFLTQNIKKKNGQIFQLEFE